MSAWCEGCARDALQMVQGAIRLDNPVHDCCGAKVQVAKGLSSRVNLDVLARFVGASKREKTFSVQRVVQCPPVLEWWLTF